MNIGKDSKANPGTKCFQFFSTNTKSKRDEGIGVLRGNEVAMNQGDASFPMKARRRCVSKRKEKETSVAYPLTRNLSLLPGSTISPSSVFHFPCSSVVLGSIKDQVEGMHSRGIEALKMPMTSKPI